MRLIAYEEDGREALGVMVDGEQFVELARVHPDLARTMRGLLEAGEEALDRAREAASSDAPKRSLAEVSLLPVVSNPHAIWCVGVNYAAHREETGRAPSDHPTMFLRLGASQVGHGRAIVRPKASVQFDYEGELAVVIGRAGRHVDEKDALHYVAGYACYNDGTIRDWQRHTSQFGPGKNFERTGAFGPWLSTADEVPDPHALSLSTRVSGEELQRTTTDLMLFRIPRLIAYLSTVYELRPGDVISTGTPSGVGAKRTPPRWLVEGDVVEVDIEGVGTLRNPVVDER